MNQLLISLVTYNNNYEELKKLLESITSNTIDLNYHIIVIDNSPSDRLKEFFSSFQNITYKHSTKNLGYGSAHNIAIRHSIQEQYKYHLVINPDISFNTSVLNQLFDYMELNNEVGNVMPKILDFDGEIQYLCKRKPTPFDLFARRFLPSKYSIKGQFIYEMRNHDYNKATDAECLSGCFMFMRCSVLEKVGLFDERFFMYMEDLDLTRRISDQSICRYYPSVAIFHEHKKSSFKINKLFFAHIFSAIQYFNKWGWLPLSRKL